MRKKERLWRHFMALLAAVCMLNAAPYTSVTVNANENTIYREAEEKETPEQAEDEGQTDASGVSETEDTGQAGEQEKETEDIEETEESKGPEETEWAEDAENGGEEPADSGKEDSGTGEAEDTEESEAEAPDLENTELSDGSGPEETGETVLKEDAGESAVLLMEGMEEGESAEEGSDADTSYTDENGVVYHYHSHEDGTAELYEITDYFNKDVRIPASIDGHAVTQLTFHIWGMISSVTIPETVTYIGKTAFVDAVIGTLYYNAAEEVKVEPMPNAPFRHTEIGNLVTGESVRIIPAELFAFAEFQEDITITVETVGEEAFKYASFPSLNLTEQVKEIRKGAFVGTKMQTLHYDTEAEHTAETTTDGMFWGASIQELDIGEGVTRLPDYVFCRADFCFNEYTVNVEQIGDHAFDRAWESAENCCERLVLSDKVKYIGADAFANNYITMLELQADAASGASSENDGCFFWSHIDRLHIGETVSVIPDYLFSNAYITMDELILNVERIGKAAFYKETDITELTIGEKVKEIGINAFAEDHIAVVLFNAVKAALGNGGREADLSDAPFKGSTVESLSFGEQVTAIPDTLFAGMDYTADRLSFPDSLTSIGRHAFHSAGIRIGELTIGENVTSIGKGAFMECSLNVLNYNAIEAELPGITAADYYGNPFYLTETGELRIGGSVRILPDYLFYCLRLEQEELTIPDSVTSIGTGVLSTSADSIGNGRISIGTLTIGENVSHIGDWAFGCGTYNKAVIYTNQSDSEIRDSFRYYLPVCGQVEIHGNSPYYRYFTDRSEKENITLLCETFETTYGKESYDEAQNAFVTTVTERCTVCGHEETHEESRMACTVIFKDYDGRELSKQYVAAGSDAEAPEIPERTGHDFTGWDKSFQNVTSDIVVTAQYEARTFSVVFKDGENIISEQKVAYGCDAKLPRDPERLAEAWGRWKFIGWSGNDKNIVQDEVLQARFEKILNEYEVLFYDADGNLYSRQTVAHGGNAELPDAPEKQADAQYSYTFTGWDGDTDGIVEDSSFYPCYEEKIRSYTVTFVNDGKKISTQSVAYGQAAAAPEEIPEKTGCDFIGWDKDYTNIVSDLTVTARYRIKSFHVTFQDGETVVSRQKTAYGNDARLPENPSRPEEVWGTWKFTGWEGNYKNVMQDEVLQARFEKILNEHEVLFYDAYGNVHSRQTVTHGENASMPDGPEKKPTAQYHYTFAGWDKETENITGNTAVHPLYDAALRSYTVTFLNDDTVLDTQTVAYGQAAQAPEDPERAEEEWGTWRFTGWDGSYTDITADMTIRAQFEKVFHEYEVVFYDADGNLLSRQTISHGQTARAPKAPEKEPTEQHCYPFTGWSGDITNITDSAVFYPVYGMETRSYTVTFINGDTVFDTQTIPYGAAAARPAEPERASDTEYCYHFTGWDKDYSFITGDTVLHAVYEQKELPKESGAEEKKEESDSACGNEKEKENGSDRGAETASDDNAAEKADFVTETDSRKKPDAGAGTERKENRDICKDTGMPVKGEKNRDDHAVWGSDAEDVYTVRYNANGGTTKNPSVRVAKGAGVKLPTAEREGFLFTGWYTDGQIFIGGAGDTCEPDADMTLFAGWEKADDGSGRDDTAVKSGPDAGTGIRTEPVIGNGCMIWYSFAAVLLILVILFAVLLFCRKKEDSEEENEKTPEC